MLKKLRKSSGRVTLVLIGVAALPGCSSGDDQRRDVYATREDCLADWANKPQDCTPASDPRHSSRGYWYGPSYGYHSPTGSAWSGSRGSTSRSIGSSSGVSRGGFGSSGRSSGG
jgi:uncharacterized protein YgiB involved in biofilm formation